MEGGARVARPHQQGHRDGTDKIRERAGLVLELFDGHLIDKMDCDDALYI